MSVLLMTPPINAQCRSIPIKIVLLSTTLINVINADQFFSILIGIETNLHPPLNDIASEVFQINAW